MTKLFPPSIEGKLPAFYISEQVGELFIPFTMNRAVSAVDCGGMSLIIKSVQTNTIICDGRRGAMQYDDKTKQYYARFEVKDLYSSTLDSKKLTPGQYYKIQIAYVRKDTNEIGYYSSVGTIKCTSEPKVEILNIDNNSKYYGSYDYTGKYSQEGGDITEKVYSYQFYLKDAKDNVVATSGEQIHNSSTDKHTYESTDTWMLNKELPEGEIYTISYEVTTINGLKYSSVPQNVIQQGTVDMETPCELVATLDDDDGCIRVALRPVKDSPMTGSYVLSRSSSEDDYTTWDEIYRFNFKNVICRKRENNSRKDVNDILLWEDFTVQHGIKYVYALQARNEKGLHSNKLRNKEEVSNFVFDEKPVVASFEDAYLFDGEKQLRLRFNPKVSSFKATVLETKTDTIGGKHPFIFRNGNVDYKEFPISGLISLISDPNERFLKGIQGTSETFDMNLTSDNIQRERIFKLAVLEWLTNGEPKLFRSPTEGNYIVRLMNTSLTPNDTLGRMIHTFSSTAYEIADCTYDNLNKYGFIAAPQVIDKELRPGQIVLKDYALDKKVVLPFNAYQVKIQTSIEGQTFILSFEKNYQTQVCVGHTGTYIVPEEITEALIGIELLSDEWGSATLDFLYYDERPTDNFSFISNLSVKDEIRQFIGAPYRRNENSDIIQDVIEDVRRSCDYIHLLKIYQRPLHTIYYKDGSYYESKGNEDPIGEDEWDILSMYEVRDFNTDSLRGYFLYPEDNHKITSDIGPDYYFKLNDNIWIDVGGNNIPYLVDEYGNKILDEKGNPIKGFTTLGRYDALTDINNAKSLRIGSGVCVDIAYRIKEIEYSFEDYDNDIKAAKSAWKDAEDSWLVAIGTADAAAKEKQMNETYAIYVSLLEEHIKEASNDGSLSL